MPWAKHWVKAEPTLLFYDGQFLADIMRRQRVVEAEVRAAIRAQGLADLRDVAAVVLETDGSFTVIRRPSGAASAALPPGRSALHGVQHAPPP